MNLAPQPERDKNGHLKAGIRLPGWDYCKPWIYMITLVVKRRRPILGEIADGAIRLSPLGEAVARAWQEIANVFPEVEPCQYAVMPEHFHGIIWVHERLRSPLGEVIRSFKIACSKANLALAAPIEIEGSTTFWFPGLYDTILFSRGQLKAMTRYVLRNAERRWAVMQNPDLFKKTRNIAMAQILAEALGERLAKPAEPAAPAAPNASLAPVAPNARLAPAAPNASHAPAAPNAPVAPVAPNARRAPAAPNASLAPAAPNASLAPAAPNAPVAPAAPNAPVAPAAPNARLAPAAPTAPVAPVAPCARVLPAAPCAAFPGLPPACDAVGNAFLLSRAHKLLVQVSRRATLGEIEAKVNEALLFANRGGVIVSGCISPGEQQVARAVREAGLPLIAIIPRGFGPYFKPSGAYFDACAAGRLLMLSPFPQIGKADRLTRERCFGINAVAAAICGNDPAAIHYHGSQPGQLYAR